MPITYDAPSNIITVTGYTEESPCTFLDIWNADQAGGWGVVSKLGTNLFKIDCRLNIGDGATFTYFADTMKTILLTYFPSGGSAGIYVTKGNFRLGICTDATKKTTKEGCTIYAISSNWGYLITAWYSQATLEIYGSTILNLGTGINIYPFDSNLKMYESTFDSTIMPWGREYDIYRCNFMSDKSQYPIGTFGGVFDDLYIHDKQYAFWLGGGVIPSITAKNLKLRRFTAIACSYNRPVDDYLINVDADEWAFVFTAGSTGKIYRQYELDVHVSHYKDGSDISGAIVILYDKDGNQIFSETTDANGDVATKTVTYGYYDQPHGNTLQSYSPHKLVVKKAGYQTEQDIFDIDEKKVLQISLQKAITVFFDMGRPVVNLKKVDPENKNVMVL